MADQNKPTRLFLVRHGEVVSQGQGKFLGFTDLGLSNRGKRQVQSLAEYLQEAPLDQAYASDLKRAVDSARSICHGRSIKLVTRPAFREMNMGDWDGKSWEEVKKKDPGIKSLFFYDLKNFYFPGGENWTQFRVRVLKGLKILLKENQGKDILLVAHAGVNRIILARALGLRYKNMFFMDQAYACLNIIECYGNSFKLTLMNGIFYK